MPHVGPHAPAHIRATWSGVFGTTAAPVEIWSMGLAFSPGTLAAADKTTALTALTSAVGAFRSAFTTNVIPRISGAATLTRTRLALVGGTGHVDRTSSGQYVQADDLTTTIGSGATVGHAFQVAYTVRTQTPMAGPTGRGRFYLPAPFAAVASATGLISTIDQATMVTSMDAFVTACNTAANAGWSGQAVVASAGSATKGLPPALHLITSVMCGRVLDTQQRRRRELEEQYQSGVITA